MEELFILELCVIISYFVGVGVGFICGTKRTEDREVNPISENIVVKLRGKEVDRIA